MTQLLDAPPQSAKNGDLAVAKPMNLRAPVGSAMTLKKLLEASRQQIADVLPKHLTPERIVKVALIAVNKTPKLLNCTMESVLQSVMQAAALGLDPGGALGSAYLVPYGAQCQLITGYRGLIDLARRSGEIASISADVIYAHDKFVYRKGTDPALIHEPDINAEQKDEDIIGAYMVAHLKDGGKHVEFMNRQQILKIRDNSKAAFDYNGNLSGPWLHHFSEMCRKTVIRRGSKYLPISSEKFAAALDLDNEADGMPGISIAANASRTASLMDRLTQRPVSEGHTFIPDPAAIALAQAEAGDTSIGEQQSPEPDVSGIDPGRPDELPPSLGTHEALIDALNGAAMDLQAPPSSVGVWWKGYAVSKGVKGKEQAQTPEWRAAALADYVAAHGGK